jgi:hypothetical protein
MATTTITLGSEGKRRALLFAVWERAANEIGQCFYDGLHLEARASLGVVGSAANSWFREVPDEMALMTSTMDAARALQTAPLDEAIDLEMPIAALVGGLTQCAEHIAENEKFWLLPDDERQRALDTFDAAQVLIHDFDREAVA